MKRALVIAHEPDCGAAQVEVRLRQRGFDVDIHVVTPVIDRPNEATPWPEFAHYDALIVMGSIRNLPNKQEISSWIDHELRLLREAHDRGQPVLGICFGGQLMAEALGGRVETAPVAEVGWIPIRALPGALNPVGPGPWLAWHHDRFVPPDGAEVLAETDDAIQLFRLGRTVGTQFHPEVDSAHLAVWLNATDDEYLAANGQTRQGLIEETERQEKSNAVRCHALVDWWLDDVAFTTEGLQAVAER